MCGLPGWVRMTVVAALAGAAALASAAQTPATQPRLAFRATTREDAQAWQQSGRKRLFELLGLLDLVQAEKGATTRPESPLKPAVGATQRLEKFTRYDVQISPTAARTIPVVLTVPHGAGKFPAVVCIHGHGHDRNTVYEPDSIYRGFALALAQRGYVTISADVGQHKVSQPGLTLVGERLWDLMSCVAYLRDRPEVDGERIACAGLSLGGEMAMWLGAMDTRVKAVVSSGFLTTVENLRQGHCPCWEFPGLTENFDIPDVYCLIAPRRLQCQIGRKEAAPGGFPVPVAEKAMEQVRRAYKALGSPDAAALAVHDEGHVFDLASALAFLDTALSRPAEGRRVHVFISGRVQGVGFRAFTRQEALALKLTGWVKNLADGRVEAVVEGPPDKVAALLVKLRRGPEGARVDKLDARDEAHTGELDTFEVRF